MKKLYRGDYWSLIYTIYDANGNPLNLVGWQIRAEFYDYANNVSIKRTSGISGGPGNIDRIDEQNGKIRVKFLSSETETVPSGYYVLEIEITKGVEKYTVVKEQYEVLEEKIRW